MHLRVALALAIMTILKKWHYYKGMYPWNGGHSTLLAWDDIS